MGSSIHIYQFSLLIFPIYLHPHLELLPHITKRFSLLVKNKVRQLLLLIFLLFSFVKMDTLPCLFEIKKVDLIRKRNIMHTLGSMITR